MILEQKGQLRLHVPAVVQRNQSRKGKTKGSKEGEQIFLNHFLDPSAAPEEKDEVETNASFNYRFVNMVRDNSLYFLK